MVRDGIHQCRFRAASLGIGRGSYTSLFNILELQGLYNLFAGITLLNDASVELPRSFGFNQIAIERSVGYKLGRWQDVGMWQVSLRPHLPNPESVESIHNLTNSQPWRSAISAGLGFIRTRSWCRNLLFTRRPLAFLSIWSLAFLKGNQTETHIRAPLSEQDRINSLGPNEDLIAEPLQGLDWLAHAQRTTRIVISEDGYPYASSCLILGLAQALDFDNAAWPRLIFEFWPHQHTLFGPLQVAAVKRVFVKFSAAGGAVLQGLED